MSADIDTIVVGAGVVGLAIARALALNGRDVLVLEKNAMIGGETSSRNSEVIHAGIYYQPGSLRARLCLRGKELLYEFCSENAVAIKRCGKLLVATSAEDLPMLKAICQRAALNGVTDLVPLSKGEALALEPELACHGAALSPSTGVVDTHGLMAALDGHIASLGGQIVPGSEVTGLARNSAGAFELATLSGGKSSVITCNKLVLSAGLHASALGRLLHRGGAYRPPETFRAKGHYFSYSGPAPFSRPIYPMPLAGWLGLHMTLDIAGQTKFGPDLEWTGRLDYSFEDPEKRKQIFLAEIRRYYPQIEGARLQPGYTGIRPKLYRRGDEVADFAIHDQRVHAIAGLVALYGIESPGLTSSLAIGEHVAAIVSRGG